MAVVRQHLSSWTQRSPTSLPCSIEVLEQQGSVVALGAKLKSSACMPWAWESLELEPLQQRREEVPSVLEVAAKSQQSQQTQPLHHSVELAPVEALEEGPPWRPLPWRQ
mgnify:CR=1 FL=1